MLPDPALPLPASPTELLACFRPLFTAPPFRTFCALASGFLAHTGRRTVCGMLTGAGLSRVRGHDRAHPLRRRGGRHPRRGLRRRHRPARRRHAVGDQQAAGRRRPPPQPGGGAGHRAAVRALRPLGIRRPHHASRLDARPVRDLDHQRAVPATARHSPRGRYARPQLARARIAHRIPDGGALALPSAPVISVAMIPAAAWPATTPWPTPPFGWRRRYGNDARPGPARNPWYYG